MTPTPNLVHGRHPERAATARETVHEILDAERICHVAFVADGWPYAVPTIHARDGDRLLIHGSTLSRMLGTLAAGVPACVTVTAVDGIVCARSVFNHSMNYRSVMVLGTATPIREAEEKLAALQVIVEHVLPGRWAEVRPPKPTELRATEIVSIPLDQVTAKFRNAGSIDTPADLKQKVWCGVLPIERGFGQPILVPDDVADLSLPSSVVEALRRGSL